MMKPTAFVIIFYILFLLTQPCQDVFGAPRASGESTAAGRTANEEDCKEGEDGCSPFCICACRQAPAGYFSIDPTAEPKLLIRPVGASDLAYSCRFPVASLEPIWQPPKN